MMSTSSAFNYTSEVADLILPHIHETFTSLPCDCEGDNDDESSDDGEYSSDDGSYNTTSYYYYP